MKKWFLPLLTALLLAGGCGVLGESREDRMAREAQEAQMVRDAVDAGQFTISIDRMYPLRGMGRSVSSYSVKVKDGVLHSYLPYIGEAWQVPYGGGHGLNFDAEIGHYSAAQVDRDSYEIRLYVKTVEDEHLYLFRIFDNGRTTLDVQSRNRQRISYSGTMDFNAK